MQTFTTAKREKIVDALASTELDREICVKAWVRTKRGSKLVNFIALNDGSSMNNIQVVVDLNLFSEDLLKKITTGACISVVGKLVASQGKGQNVEINAEKIELLGEADSETFPLQKKGHTLEFLREIAHLRMRTNTFSAVMRIRHHLAFAVHQFFHERGFFYLHTPVITASDAEGAGQMFQVTTLKPNAVPVKDGLPDFTEDFFGRAAHLTVSGQLEAELGAMALGQVYTFGPTFRAENSNTARHLSEFWMIEPEVAFADIYENMDLAEAMLKYLVQNILDKCPDDVAFLCEMYDKELTERLKFVLAQPFERITYTQAIDILLNSEAYKKGKFEYKVAWGIDLQSEHERYLVEKHFKKPVIVTGYPKDIKAFYMRLNEDGKTVAAMDILFPNIGEIIGGSQREERLENLEKRMEEMGMHAEGLWWYLDTRRFGTAPHAGFGLGFERLMMFVTGMSNIRDVIPFPRAPKSAEF